jgi:CHASE1-domain containing sensor protein
MNERQPSDASWLSNLWNHYLPVLLAIFIGAALSVGAFSAARWRESREIAVAFRTLADERAWAVKDTFQREITMLEMLRTSLMTDGKVEKAEFGDLLAPFHSHDNSIEAVEWLPRVSNDNRAEFEETARKDGFSNFKITEPGPKGDMIPAKERSEYFPIFYCGPRPANKAIVGYDVGSEKNRVETLCDSRDSGNPVAGGRIEFIQDSTNASGFLVCLPVYEKGKPRSDVADRRKSLLGFLTGVFRPSDMLNAAMTGLTPAGIDVCLFDASKHGKNETLDFHTSRTREDRVRPIEPSRLDNANEMIYKLKLDVAGHPWTIACLPAPDFVSSRRAWGPWIVLAGGLAFTTALAIYLLLSVNHKKFLEDTVREQTADIRRTQEEVIYRLISAAQWSDEETGTHIRRTGLLSEVLARAASWYGEDLEHIRQAAPLHDIGKIGIPDAILRKPGKLTPEEFEVMKTHTRIGADILAGSNVPMLQMAREVALNHHERWDGKGYPRGLAGKAIPESARIVAIVDVYDALTHDRVYRPALPENEVLTIMQQGAGTQFDPLLMTLFFLHLSEIRNISQEHPDSTVGSTLTQSWGHLYPAVTGATIEAASQPHSEAAAAQA